MGTKNEPGRFDCYAKAEPDEPIFALLARDPHAAALVRMWALLRTRAGEDEDKITEALACADSMERWAREHRGRMPYPGCGERSQIEAAFLALTPGLDAHPEGYDDACDCDLCRSYG